MCYALSVGADPFGPYYRYEFIRPFFPDYPRPAVWPDGYYVPTSTGDEVIQKHACVADRARMLRGEDATEQCVIIDDVNFLNNADLDGTRLPPPGAPNVMMAAGGMQLHGGMEDDGIYVWAFHVDWADPAQTRVEGPTRISVAPYHYLCDGRRGNEPRGRLAPHETVLAEGEAAQTNTLRWEDSSQTAVDPSDDCTIWYVGDYLKRDAASYSSRIGAFRFPGCGGR